MLHKSFKPAKCKTSLKLATSRIKLMKNKKGVQINQMKRELAQLLETSQDRTARIRVEHVIREEKMVAAYELIEIYCELIVARLPIIESQKTCPIDLKEAVTSVIFAAPRCSDISELSDIKKQFTAKYGKDFVTAAIELRPDCGVSRMLIEKLSAAPPDLQTKIKVLSTVAKEYNIEWDPTSLEEKESKPPNDLLNGPPNIESASMAIADPPKIQPSNIKIVLEQEEKPKARVDFSEQNKKYTLGTQNVHSTDNGGETSSGVTSERIETKQNWNMEFKDATAAAEAAAESAERAAMAARAAAQFSNREKMANQHPHVSNVRDKMPHVSATSASISGGEQATAESAERAAIAAAQKREKMANQQPHVSNIREKTARVSTTSGSVGDAGFIDSYERYSDDRNPNLVNKHTDRSNGPTSFRSDSDSVKDEILVNNVHMADDDYFEESLHEYQEEGFKESENEYPNENSEYENVNFIANEGSRKQLSTSSDEVDVGKKFVVGNPFAVVDQESPFEESTNTSSKFDVPRDNDDDDVISDDDDVGPSFDSGFDYDEFETTNSLENSHIWSPRRKTVDQPNPQSHLFSESLSFGDHSVKSMGPSEAGDRVPASFDHSDGPDSESENEEPPFMESNYSSTKTRIELDDLVEDDEPSSFYNPENEERKPQSHPNFDQEISDTFEDDHSELDSRKELNFGTLTGGLRNKGGLRYPPLTKTHPESSVTGSLDSRSSKMEIFAEISDLDSEKSSKRDSTRTRFTVPDVFFNDDETEPEEVVSKPVPSRARLGSGLSRRTRGSLTVPLTKSQVELEPEPEPKTVGSTSSDGSKPVRFSYLDEIPESQQPSSRKTGESGRKKSTAFEPRVNHSVNTKQETVESVSELKMPIREPSPVRITVESGKAKNAETLNLGSESLLGGNKGKKPSHVHPKLPDYESLAARLQSMRTDQQ